MSPAHERLVARLEAKAYRADSPQSVANGHREPCDADLLRAAARAIRALSEAPRQASLFDLSPDDAEAAA